MNKREQVQLDALNIALKHDRCGLGISMGVGKTRIAIQHLKHNFNPLIKALVVIPKHSIAQSWIDEMGKMKLSKLINHITFTTYLSLKKQNPDDYDIVYLDECHSILNNHEKFLSSFNGKILGLTGTPPQGFEKELLVNKYCPIKFKFTVDDATDSNILNNYNIIVHELELSKTPNLLKKRKDGGQWQTTEVKDYSYVTSRYDAALTQSQRQFAAIMRMRALMSYTSKEVYTKSLLNKTSNKVIVFANTQDQADRICKHSYHSKNKKSQDNLELFSDGRIDKLSCVLQLSEGVSIPNLKEGIIMHSYSNERKTAQRIGRLLRLNPTQTAVCHILCYKGTQDEVWVKNSLKDFDQTKIKHFNPNNKQIKLWKHS